VELTPGTLIDRYTLEAPLGAGGQGAVWRAEDRLQPGRAVALKLVPLAADSAHLERVRREARHLARLKHPGLPACHGLFEDLQHGLLVVAMELVQGPTLAEAIPALDDDKKSAVLRQLAATLAFLHNAGVVHRDVKPENLILCHEFWADPVRQGAVKLIDLGISISSGNPQPLTVVGHVIGTPSFLAPEILDPHYFPGLQDAPAVDVFAFGVLGWMLLQGGHPTGLLDGSSMASYALAYRQADQLPRWPGPARSDRWEPLLRRCLAVRARERFPSASDLLAALTGGDAGLTPHAGATRLESVIERSSVLPERTSSLPATRLDLVPLAPSTLPPAPPAPPASPSVQAPASPAATPIPGPAPATVFAAPLPTALREQSRPSAPAPVALAPAARPAAPALAAPPGRAPLAPHASPAALAPPERKTSLLRYLLAGFLLLVGGGLAFVLTLFLFILFHLAR
jgi:serine/threonine-protein kinase